MWVLTVLVAPVPCPIDCAIGKDPQEVAAVAAVEQFGLLIVSWRQIKLLGQGCEGCDLPFGHGSVATNVVLLGLKKIKHICRPVFQRCDGHIQEGKDHTGPSKVDRPGSGWW